MTVLLERPLLRSLTDQELAAMFGGDFDDEIVAEMARRDECERRRKARRADPVAAEWRDAAYAQYLAAEEQCRGNLVRRDSAVTDGWDLWSGSERFALANCTEELAAFWLDHPRITVTQYQEHVRQQRGIHDDELERDEPGAVRPGAGEGQAGPPVRGVGAADAVSGPAAGADQEDRAGNRPARDRGHARATQGGCMTTIDDRPVKSLAGQQIRARMAARGQEPDGLAEFVSPRATAEVAVPETSAVAVPDAISGEMVLDAIRVCLGYFAIWPSEESLNAAALWVAQTHAREPVDGGWELPVWQYAPHFFLTSEHGGSGKSRMLGLMLKLCPTGKSLIDPSKASLKELIAQRATIGITELDRLLGERGTRNSWAVAIPNAAYERDHTTSKMVGGVAKEFPIMTSFGLDGLDVLLKVPALHTLFSRCQIVHARKGPKGYRPPRFDREAIAEFGKVRDLTAQWVSQCVAAGIGDYVPELPEGVGNRAAAIWEPSAAIAHYAGGAWPERCADACVRLEASSGLPAQEAVDQIRSSNLLAAWAQKQGVSWGGESEDLL